MRTILILISIIFLNGSLSFSAVKLPRLISDGMILQRNVPIPIWGWADPAEEVTIQFNQQLYRASADHDGKWSVTIPAMKAGGPFTMEVKASNTIIIQDILIGDVWVCSGQSNMAQVMERVKDRFPEVIAETNNSQLRHFFVPTTYNFQTPQSDLPPGTWKTATPENILQFPAIGLFFATSLFEKYHVPIGIINASVGGSPAEAWLSEKALLKFPTHLAVANKYKNTNFVDSIRRQDRSIHDQWYQNVNATDIGLTSTPRWHDVSIDDRDWKSMTIPGYWADQGLPKVNGVVWFRKKIIVPESMRGKQARLFLGNIVDLDSVYLNGQFVGTTGYQYPPRKYNVPAGMLRAGENLISIRVINNSGRGGFYQDKPYLLKIDNDTIDLRGSWKFKVGMTTAPLPPSTTFQYLPGGLFNGMIAPLLNLRIKGILWYQGESNTGRAGEYESLLSTLIHDWREHWQQGNFPFLYVQLANFMERKNEPGESNWAALRDAQRRVLKVSNTAMTVAIDVGEWNDIHPLDKKTVGERLALNALKLAYNDKKVVHMGPLFESYTVRKNQIILNFSNTGSGLVSKGAPELRYFSICGADKKFVWAKATIQGNKVTVWSDDIKDPVAVRYAWADNPEGANLYNREGLPASPFTTETK